MTDRSSAVGNGGRSLPDDWAELAPLLDEVLAADAADRAAVLDRMSHGDARIRAALSQLLSECEAESRLLAVTASERFPALAADDEAMPAMPAMLGGRYVPTREIGRGGMARVFLARDERHGRDVAIKVIRAELAASLGRERFLREIEIAARLRHPNIIPLYDSGDADGMLYFVMPFEEGPSLKTRIAAGPVAIADVIALLRDVARALQYAHERGVVHRDIKPDNVMLSGGAAVVADFGIAKAVRVAQGSGATAGLTQTGTGIGTPAYMAPEQAIGDPSTDHRADIYSFGCLAYELLTGKPPFQGQSAHQVIAAHISAVPVSVASIRSDSPPAIAALVMRCLEKDPTDRPQSSADVVTMLEGAVGTFASTSATALRVPPADTARTSRRTIAVSVLLVAVAVTGAALWLRPGVTGTDGISIAVLPFGNTTSDSALSPFVAGIGDEVFVALSRVPGLQMRSRSGARSFTGQLAVDTREAGKRLNVDYLITGVMREDHGRWIISTELERVADGTEMWSDSFNRSPEQQIGIAEEIASAAAGALRSKFPRALGVAPALAVSQQTKNPEAYRLYVLGQELLRRRGQSISESADAFRQAIRLDSTYAAAYGGLSLALGLYPHFQGIPAPMLFPELQGAALRALAIDSTLAQPHVALGLAFEHDYQWQRSEDEFRTALRIESNDVEAHVQYGRHLFFRGRVAEGLKQFQLARREDPASPLVLSWLSYGLGLTGQQDSALAISRQARQGGTLNYTAHTLGSEVLLQSGLKDSALALTRRLLRTTPGALFMEARLGDATKARATLAAFESQIPTPSLANTARAFYMLGMRDTAQALTALERATDAREIWPAFQPVSALVFDGVRGSAHLAALLQRVGLPPSLANEPTKKRNR